MRKQNDNEADPKFQIGYSVRPCDRGHGYAKWMLKQLLAWLKKSGLSEAPIACEPSNVAIFICLLDSRIIGKKQVSNLSLDNALFAIFVISKFEQMA